MKTIKQGLCGIVLFSAALCASADIEENKDYRVLPDSVTKSELVQAAPGSVEVLEFFSYGCPACNSLAPSFHAWAEKAPANVVVKRVPVIFFEGWDVLAKAYYTAAQMNALDKVDLPLFDAIHKQQRQLTDAASVRAVFVENGANGADFDKTFSSFAVDHDMQQGKQLMQHYKVFAVPTVIVGGRYVTDLELAKSPAHLIEIVNDLVNKTPPANAQKAAARSGK